MKNVINIYSMGFKKFLLKIYKYRFKPRKTSSEISGKGYESNEIVIPNSANEDSSRYRIYLINHGSINTDNTCSDCFISEYKELLDRISFGYDSGRHLSGAENNIFNRYPYSEQIKTVSGTVFSLLSGGGGFSNYYHWLFDVLPRLKILQEAGLSKQVDYYLVPNSSQKFKKQSLEILNINSSQIIDSKHNPHIKATQIIATTHPNTPKISTWVCQFLRSSFLKAESTPSKRIFISRSKAKKRRIENENDIFQILKLKGFQKIFLEDLSFLEQVNLFSESELIVAPHGAGLANLVFCTKHTKVFELFPKGSDFNLFKTLSEMQNIEHYPIWGTNGDSDLHSDFTIDPYHLLAEIDVACKP